jgi:diguanylate cyclase (GGDEF)-like protein/putative nucleotidyltransferase with HDIG domain
MSMPRDGAPLRLVRAGMDDGRSVAQLVEDGQRAERRGQLAEARADFEAALQKLAREHTAGETQLATGALVSSILRWIARTHFGDGDVELAFDVLEAAIAVAEEHGDCAAVGHALNVRSGILLQLGDLDGAESGWLEVHTIAKTAGDAKLAAMTMQNLGVVANVRGDLPLALQHYEACLADFRALGMAREVGAALNNLGKLYADGERWDEATRAFEESLQISTLLGDLSSAMLLETNVAELHVARGNAPAAREACARLRALASRVVDNPAAGEIEKVHGVVARLEGDYARAMQHLLAAERIATERQHVLLAAETEREKAELFRLQGRNRDMLQSLNHAHRLFAQLSARRELADVSRRNARLEADFLNVVQRWGSSIESKDRYTQGHCERVADIACALARRTGMDEQSLFWFRIGALLHDVGKLIIPAEVLNKPGKLTDDEWALVKAHPTAGVEMLSDIDFPWDVRPIVQSHHERWDGRGYPHGLAGDAIPINARILCLADVYDALTSDRSYKPALVHADAMAIMRDEVGTQFDPALFALFDQMMTDGAPAPRSAPGPLEERTDPIEQEAQVALALGGPRDDLTGLPLRRAIVDTATATLRRALGVGRPLSLLVIDVDNFKLVNDTYGHLQGDAVLRAVAGLLQAEVEPHHVVGRYAGDEFVVLLPGLDGHAAQSVAERLRAAAQRLPIPGRDGRGAVHVSLSIGVASAPKHGQFFETLFDSADRALYAAKRAGRNAVATADVADGAAAQPRLQIERFVGRAAERRLLARALEASSEGRPGLVAVSGEAGVGKSTLLRQLEPEIRLRAGALVVGRAAEADLKPPYGPWAEVVSGLHRAGLIEAGPWVELPLLVPALGRHAPSEGPHGRYALLDEILACVRAAAKRCPLVLLLDDMQWADAASWDALEHLMHGLEDDRVLVCMTVRAEDAGAEVLGRRRSLSRDARFHEIALRRLDEDELREWLGAIFRRADPGDALVPYLYRQSEGNPFLVVQLLRALVEEDALHLVEGRWEWRPEAQVQLPVGISDLMARRIERLSGEARRILTTAAVIGRAFDVDLLVAATGDEEDALDALDEGIKAHVIEHGADRDGDHYVFAHGLLVDAMHASINGRRLRRVHQTLAEALAVRPGAAAADVARHFDAAGDGVRAYAFAMKAGAQAAALYAQGEADVFYAMAERHAPDAEALIDARLRRAGALEAAGRYADAESLYALVLQPLEAATLDGARLLGVQRALERVRAQRGQPAATTLAECTRLLADAERLEVPAERVALLIMLSQTHARLGERAEAQVRSREAVALADGMADDRMTAEAVIRLGSVLLDESPDEAVLMYRRAHELFARLDDKYGQVRCHINMGVGHSRLGDERAAEDAYRAGYALGVNAHAPDLAGLAALNLGVLHLKAGTHDAAVERVSEALRLFTACRSEPHRLAALYNLAHLAREARDLGAAAERYQATVELARQLGQADVEIGAIAGLGLVGLALGRSPVANGARQETLRLLSGRESWWFQGREVVEALSVHLTLAESGAASALAQLEEVVERAARHDAYAAAWLLAECGPPLHDAGASLRPLLDRWRSGTSLAPALDYGALRERLARLHD